MIVKGNIRIDCLGEKQSIDADVEQARTLKE